MQNGDEDSPSNILAGQALLVKMRITLDAWYILFRFCKLMYFNIVQQLVCKTVTRLHLASFWGRSLLVKILITLEPHSIFGSNFVYYCILTLSSRGYVER